MNEISKLAKALLRERIEAIETRLLWAAGTGKDLAVFEHWEGTTLTIRFELVEPDGPLPPGSTVYRISQMATGRA